MWFWMSVIGVNGLSVVLGLRAFYFYCRYHVDRKSRNCWWGHVFQAVLQAGLGLMLAFTLSWIAFDEACGKPALRPEGRPILMGFALAILAVTASYYVKYGALWRRRTAS